MRSISLRAASNAGSEKCWRYRCLNSASVSATSGISLRTVTSVMANSLFGRDRGECRASNPKPTCQVPCGPSAGLGLLQLPDDVAGQLEGMIGGRHAAIDRLLQQDFLDV